METVIMKNQTRKCRAKEEEEELKTTIMKNFRVLKGKESKEEFWGFLFTFYIEKVREIGTGLKYNYCFFPSRTEAYTLADTISRTLNIYVAPTLIVLRDQVPLFSEKTLKSSQETELTVSVYILYN